MCRAELRAYATHVVVHGSARLASALQGRRSQHLGPAQTYGSPDHARCDERARHKSKAARRHPCEAFGSEPSPRASDTCGGGCRPEHALGAHKAQRSAIRTSPGFPGREPSLQLLEDGVIAVEFGWDRVEGRRPTKSRNRCKVPIARKLRELLAAELLRTGRRGEELIFGSTPTSPFQPQSLRTQRRSAHCVPQTVSSRTGYYAAARSSAMAFTNASSCLVVQHSKTPSQNGSYADITESP